MWSLNPKNWCQFCNTADEHHALIVGIGAPLLLWPWLVNWPGYMQKLLGEEPHYIIFGMGLRWAVLLWYIRPLLG